jgi:hypothetical protein
MGKSTEATTRATLHAADLARHLARYDVAANWTHEETPESLGLANHFAAAAVETYAKLQAEMAALGLSPSTVGGR